VAALGLPIILLLGFALRIGTGLTQTHVLFFDETMQYFEQGHRLAFGSGVVPWEFDDGIRSWLLPGLIALVMHVSGVVQRRSDALRRLVRTMCVGCRW
jgi:phosphatidylinositol glycan class B